MTQNTPPEETALVDQAISWLTTELGPAFTIERSPRSVPGHSERVDDLVDIRTQYHQATLAVEARQTITPRDADRMLAGKVDMLARLANIRFLVIAPWISPRTRELLTARDVNYVDLTGNSRIRLDNPPVHIRTDGAAHDPTPSRRGVARLRGPKAGRLVRLLTEVAPPYGVREVASKANLAPGYVSQLLDALDGKALVERDGKGRVRYVDFTRLLARYAQAYELFRSNDATRYIARAGASRAIEGIASLPTPTVITGSFAAARLAPVAAPTLLAIYCADVAATTRGLDLLPADEGANVVLLRPYDPAAWDRSMPVNGARYAAPAQVALDCLSGNGRMPAEGEALLEWMSANEERWRARSLSDVEPYGRGPHHDS